MTWRRAALYWACFVALATYYMVAERQLYPRDWWRCFAYVPFLMATGIGLSIVNSKAVIEALLGIQSSFVRTPKYRVEDPERSRRVEGRGETWERKTYVRRKTGWIPFVELGLAGYFVATLAYSFSSASYFASPFLMLFLMGYAYMGTMSLFQTPIRRLWNALPGMLRERHASGVEAPVELG